MRKNRISSAVYWLVPIFIDVLFFYLSLMFLFDSRDKVSILFTLSIIFLWMIFRFTFRFKTVFVDENYLYIFKYFGYKKIELTDIKSVKEKEMIFRKLTNTYIVEYLDGNVNLSVFQFYGSFLNKSFLVDFLEKMLIQHK